MTGEQWMHRVLRVGVAFAFLYPPIRAVFDPVSWESYFPHFIRVLPVNSLVLLHGFGVIEVILALWILSGWRMRVPALVATLMLSGIVVFNWANMDIVFRDISLATMTLALALWPENRPPALHVQS